jgi:hypothetical protein
VHAEHRLQLFGVWFGSRSCGVINRSAASHPTSPERRLPETVEVGVDDLDFQSAGTDIMFGYATTETPENTCPCRSGSPTVTAERRRSAVSMVDLPSGWQTRNRRLRHRSLSKPWCFRRSLAKVSTRRCCAEIELVRPVLDRVNLDTGDLVC